MAARAGRRYVTRRYEPLRRGLGRRCRRLRRSTPKLGNPRRSVGDDRPGRTAASRPGDAGWILAGHHDRRTARLAQPVIEVGPDLRPDDVIAVARNGAQVSLAA